MVNVPLLLKFLKRLRSPRSKQTTGTLKNLYKTEYCCLGHACVVARPNNRFKKSGNFPRHHSFGSITLHTNYLPKEIAEQFGFKALNPILSVPDHLSARLPGVIRATAVTLNDSRRLTLSEIADCFEFTYREEIKAYHNNES